MSVATDLTNYQVDVTAHWPSGYVRHAFITGRASMSPSAAVSVTNGTPPSGTAITRSNIGASAVTGAYTISAGAHGSVTFNIETDAVETQWYEGHEMSEFQYVAPIGSSGMLAWLYTQVYQNGQVRAKAIIENPMLDNGAGATSTNVDRTFTPSFTLNGTVVWNNGSASLTVYKGSSIQAENSYDGWYWVNGTDPQIQPPAYNMSHWRASKMVTNQGYTGADAATLNGLDGTYAAMGRNVLAEDMGGTGEQPQIGLLTSSDAFWIATGDARAYRAMVAMASSLRSYAICVRAKNTDDIPKPSDFANWDQGGPSGGGNPGTAAGVLEWEANHHGSGGYVAYLVTGDRWHYDTMGLQAALCYLSAGNSKGNGTSRLIQTHQTRGHAWELRTIGQYVAAARDTHLQAGGIAAEYRTLLSTNYDSLNTIRQSGATQVWSGALYIYDFGGPTGNTTGWDYPASAGSPHLGSIPPWQLDFVTMTHGMLSDLKPLTSMTNQNAVRDHHYKWIVGRMGISGAYQDYDGMRGASYGLRFATDGSGATCYQSWGEVFAVSYGAGNSVAGTARQGTSGSDPTNMVGDNYWAIANAALCYAVDHGATGASDAYLRLTSSDSWSANASSSWNNYPKWAFVPRVTATATALPFTPPSTTNTSLKVINTVSATASSVRASTHTASEQEQALFNSYSGTAYVKNFSYPLGARVKWLPGGHNNAGIYDAIVNNLTTKSWQRVPNINGTGGANYTAASYQGSGFPAGDTTGSPYYAITAANNAAGELAAPAHQYGQLQPLERGTLGSVITVGRAGATADSFESPTAHYVDLSTGLTKRAVTGTFAGVGFVGCAAYDPTTQRYYVTAFNNGQTQLAYLQVNPTSYAWSTTSSFSSPSQQGGDYWSSVIYDSARLLLIMHGSHLQAWQLGNFAAGQTSLTLSGTLPSQNGINWVWHPVNKAFYARINQSGNTLHVLTPPASSPLTNAWTVSTITVGGDGLPAWNYDGGSNNQNYRPLDWVPHINCLVHEADANDTYYIKV
jgi:hypothetical protein